MFNSKAASRKPDMVIAVVLLLVCCWKPTDESGQMKNGEMLRADMDVIIPDTSDKNTLYTNINTTDKVSGSITTQKFDTTTLSTAREVTNYLLSHEDGNKVFTDYKETKALRDYVEKEHEELYDLNETINNLYEEAENRTWEFIKGKEERVKEVALNTTARLAETLMKYVNRSNELNAFIDRKNSRAEDELKMKDINMIEDDLRNVLNSKFQMDHLFNIIDINVKYQDFKKTVLKKLEEDKITRDVSLLEENVRALREMIKLLKEHIHEATVLFNFRKSYNLQPAFPSKYTNELVDIKIWEFELQLRNQDFTEYKKLLEEEKFSLLLARYINPFIQSVIFIIGFVGNGVLLIIFAKHRHMRTPPNLTVLSLTLGDFLILICYIVVNVVIDVTGGLWHYGLKLCKAYRFIRHLCLGVTVYSIVAISVQRFFALTDYCKGRGLGCRLMKKYTSILIIASAWLMASAIAIPRTVNAGVFNNRCLGHDFVDSEDYYRLVNSIDLVALCIVPLAIITVFSKATERRIKESIRNLPGEMVGMQKMKEARLLSSKILIALTAVFAVCYVPYFVYAFLTAWFKLYVDSSTSKFTSYFTFSLIFANSCSNPIAVYLASRKYRAYMKKYLLCKQWELDEDGRITSTETSSVETRV